MKFLLNNSARNPKLMSFFLLCAGWNPPLSQTDVVLSPSSSGCHRTEAGCSLHSTSWKNREDKGVFCYVHCSLWHLIVVWPFPFHSIPFHSGRLILPVGYLSTFCPHTWKNLLGLSFLADVNVLSSHLESHWGERALLIISYSRTVCLQRGPLLCGAASFSHSVFTGMYATLSETLLWLRQIKWWCLWGTVMRYHQGEKILMQYVLNAISLYDLRQKASFTLIHIQLAKSAIPMEQPT